MTRLCERPRSSCSHWHVPYSSAWARLSINARDRFVATKDGHRLGHVHLDASGVSRIVACVACGKQGACIRCDVQERRVWPMCRFRIQPWGAAVSVSVGFEEA
eukprot:3157976-Pleurochrysis_carterae.AAC.2